MGVTTGLEAEAYDNAKSARVSLSHCRCRQKLGQLAANHAFASRPVSAHYPPGPTCCPLEPVSMRASTDSSMAHLAPHRPNMAIPASPHPVYRATAILAVNPVSSPAASYIAAMCSQSDPPTATPLNLANAASLDLLSIEEQQLCSALRILPKPYLLLKELYIRENERRKGLLKRRDARCVHSSSHAVSYPTENSHYTAK